MDGISKKIYLELQAPTEDDNRSDQRRIQDGLKEQGIEAKVSLRVLRKLYPLCEEAEWKVTVALAWDGQTWHGVDLEAGDTTGLHYGVAVDLGSTTVVARLVDCATGKILGETSTFNLWNGHSDQNLSLSGRPWNAGDPSKSSGNQHYHLCERTGSTAAVTGKQLYRDGNRG